MYHMIGIYGPPNEVPGGGLGGREVLGGGGAQGAVVCIHLYIYIFVNKYIYIFIYIYIYIYIIY